MDNFILLIILTSLLVVALVIMLIYDTIEYNKERKKLKELMLIAAILNDCESESSTEQEEEVEFKNIEELMGDSERAQAHKEKEVKSDCNSCRYFLECDPLKMALAADNECELYIKK